ncbi:MAG TPA: choice-of-anchor B family protein [Chitinophagales bacterium]|nr:choice-of-anchor B family protein [Chitinophagales bacterium]
MKKALLTLTLTFTLALNFTHLGAQNFNMQFRSEVSFPYSCASIWGYSSLDGALMREYALVGTNYGVSIVEVTDPDNPVDLFDVVHQGAASEWREIKTYGHYAYATNEQDNGLLIIDLQYLPDSVKQYQFIYSQGQDLYTGHTLWIDEHGRMFVFGANGSNSPYSGYACFDLTTDPINPAFLGNRPSPYIHDGFVRGDTLWAGEIYDGQLQVINVADPANPVALAQFNTPSNFTHNAWPTHDDHYVFTTDEVDNSYLTSYDVSDLSNVTELDRAQSNPGSGTIIHNVHLLNDQFAVVAYYKDGVVLFDVSHPDNMIECGSYDTDPGESGGNYGGTWGVYPYLPSGTIIASDLSDAGANGGKLTVLTPTYVAACWLSGTVTDSVTGVLLNNVYVEVEGTQNTDNSDLSGVYKTGNGVAGTYTVRFSKFGYLTKEVQNVTLTSGVETTLDAQLVPLILSTFSGQVVDSITNAPIQGAPVFFVSTDGYQYNATSDANGNFSFNGYPGTYDIYAGKWGYHEKGLLSVVVNPNPPPFLFQLIKGYYDDFFFNLGWQSIGGVSNTGKWVRDVPIGTSYYGYDVYNPYNDVSGDLGDECYMTGNLGGTPGNSDVDGDVVTLTSPAFDLTNYNEPYINFYAWWVDGGIFGSPDDTLKFTLSNGNTTVSLMNLTSNASDPSWIFHSFKVSDFITLTNNMKLKLSTVDYQGNANWIEGGLDVFEVVDSVATGISETNMNHDLINAYPNPFSNEETISYHFDQPGSDARMDVYDVLGNKLESLPVKNSSGTFSFGKNLPEGIYFIHFVESNKMLGVIKVVKQF